MSATVDRETAEHLLSYITTARWFAGKGRLAELTAVTALPWLTEVAEWPAVRFEVATIGYLEDQDPEDADKPDAPRSIGSTELYQLALSYRSAPQPGMQHAEIGRFNDPDLGPVVVYDAMQDRDACQAILDRLLNEKRYSDGEERVGFRLVSAGGLSADLVPQIFTGQQSNTSVMFGDVAMLKLFRRLELGHNLDIEVHESLSRSGVGDVAKLFGWIDASWTLHTDEGSQPVSSDLAMVVEKLADAQDGWALALDSLRDQTGFVDAAGDLGHALADIHHALRSQFPTATVDGGQLAGTMRDRLSKAVAIAPALEPHRDGLLACFDQLAQVELTTQRVHGDFHLGQALHTPDGWKIIDFEGEPVKSLAERAEPDSVWRDIAGMLRSFDYASASVPGPDPDDWARSCRAAFLRGYTGGEISADDEAMLRAYEADKAIYEVVYEVRNRPDWVNIPLAAVAAISQASAARSEPTGSLADTLSTDSAAAEGLKE